MEVDEPDYPQLLGEYHKQVSDVMHALEPYLPTTAPAPQPASNSSVSTASATTGRQPLQVAPAAARSVVKGGGRLPGRQLLQQGNTEQDLLLVYTPAAAAELGGETALQSRAWLAVEEANKFYADSGIPITLRVVGIRRVSGFAVWWLAVGIAKEEMCMNCLQRVCSSASCDSCRPYDVSAEPCHQLAHEHGTPQTIKETCTYNASLKKPSRTWRPSKPPSATLHRWPCVTTLPLSF